MKTLVLNAILFAQIVPDAPVAPVEPIKDPLATYLRTLYEGVHQHNWWLVASLVVVGLTAAARKWGVKVWPFLGTGAAGSLLTLLFGVSGAFANALASGQEMTLDLFVWGLQVGLAASGGFSTVQAIAKELRTRKKAKMKNAS